jgi:hypothetical protein
MISQPARQNALPVGKPPDKLPEPSEEPAAKTTHLREKLANLETEMQPLAAMETVDTQSEHRVPGWPAYRPPSNMLV